MCWNQTEYVCNVMWTCAWLWTGLLPTMRLSAALYDGEEINQRYQSRHYHQMAPRSRTEVCELKLDRYAAKLL